MIGYKYFAGNNEEPSRLIVFYAIDVFTTSGRHLIAVTEAAAKSVPDMQHAGYIHGDEYNVTREQAASLAERMDFLFWNSLTPGDGEVIR